jgi:hypothetical protein
MSTTQTRRNALRLFAGPPALAILPMMMAPSDAHLLAMEAEIMRLRGLARAIYVEKVDPFEDEFHALMRVGDEAAAWAFARTYGRDAAITEAEPCHLSADRLCETLMATPALTQVGRAAKVRVLLFDILGDDWRGPDSELDWDIAQARTVFGEFAGMTAEDLADV